MLLNILMDTHYNKTGISVSSTTKQHLDNNKNSENKLHKKRLVIYIYLLAY